MEILTTILTFSGILWYLINRGKTELWGNLSYGKWITIGVAAIASFVLAFCFNLDLVFAFNLTETTTIVGKIITGFALMSGSSAVSEIIDAAKGVVKK